MEERISWKRCFLCSAPVTNITCKNDQRSKASVNLVVKYLLSDFKLEKTLSVDFLQYVEYQLMSGESPFCTMCGLSADSVLRLQLELEKIQMKIVDKVGRMKNAVISNSRLYGGNIEVKKGWDDLENMLKQEEVAGEGLNKEKKFLEMMHEFQSFIFEIDEKHTQIPLVYLNKLAGGDWPAIVVGVRKKTYLESDINLKAIDLDNYRNVNFTPEATEDTDEEYIPTPSVQVKLTIKRRSRKPPSDPLTEPPPKKPRGRPRIHPPKQPNLPKPPVIPQSNKISEARKLFRKMEQEDKSKKRRKGNQIIIQCDACDYTSLSGFNMTSHLNKLHETTEKSHQCPECEKAFTQRLSLKLHLLYHFKSKPCDVCKIRVAPSEMDTHLKTHSDKVFSCSYCDTLFGNFLNLMYHRLAAPKKHSWNGKLKCGLCSEAEAEDYDFKTDLPKHLAEVHALTDIDFKCDASDCSKTFTYPEALTVHQRWHRDQNACPHCEKGFIHKYALTNHVQRFHRVEIGAKPKPPQPPRFICDICNQKFSRENHYDRHKIEVHNFPKFKCDICPDKEFLSMCGKRWHQRVNHKLGKELPSHRCPYCPKVCNTAGGLSKHIGQHLTSKDVTCEICGFATTTLEYLRRHLKFNHNITEEDKLACGICSRKFVRRDYLIVHMRTHTKEKPYVCEVCGVAYAIKSNLNSHKKSHQNVK